MSNKTNKQSIRDRLAAGFATITDVSSAKLTAFLDSFADSADQMGLTPDDLDSPGPTTVGVSAVPPQLAGHKTTYARHTEVRIDDPDMVELYAELRRTSADDSISVITVRALKTWAAIVRHVKVGGKVVFLPEGETFEPGPGRKQLKVRLR